MKKILLTALTVISLISCQTDDKYEDKNRDPKNPTQVSPEFLFNSATKSLFDQMTSTNVNTNIFRMLGQHWTETTYVDEANYDFNTRNIPQNHWSEMYRDVLLDLATAKANNDADTEISEATRKTKNAQIEIMSVYAWAQMVETFGNIPYSQALNTGQYVLPVYDDATTIYGDLLSRLTAAIPNLTDTGFGPADKMYGGNPAKWKKFGNSLLLRMGVRVIDVAALDAKSDSAITAALAGGVFANNTDNAELTYSKDTPNTNPVWIDLVQSGRSDFVIAKTLTDKMNTLNDPRRPFYFDQNKGAGVYTGGPYGDNNSFSLYTHVSDRIIDPTNPASLLDYSEVCFYKAHVAEESKAGLTPVSAAGFYKEGMKASFQYWGASGTNDSLFEAYYVSTPAVNYATASGTWRVKIGTQLWLAMYNRGYEAWTAWRTYDFPGLVPPAVSEDPVPTRYTYPIAEQNLNKTNYTAAATAIGGDKQTTKVFWDKF